MNNNWAINLLEWLLTTDKITNVEKDDVEEVLRKINGR